jgi:hypothetical protein
LERFGEGVVRMDRPWRSVGTVRVSGGAMVGMVLEF